MNFENISASSSQINYGCTNTINFALNTFTCTNFCDLTYTVGQYNITWQAPSGWTQTSISTNGNNVSFTPDATTGGTVTATITLSCGFVETKTFNVSRTAPAPVFSSATPYASCSSTTNISIDPLCGASSYTYTIVGSSGFTFTTNGLQTLTTTSTSPSISFSGSPGSYVLKAKANYPGSNISSEVSKSLYYGSPTLTNGAFIVDGSVTPMQIFYGSNYNQVCALKNVTTSMSISGATNISWTRIAASPTNTNWSQSGNNINFYFWAANQTAVFRITASNSCSTVSNDFGFRAISCSTSCPEYQMAPNPATSNSTMVVNIPPICDLGLKSANDDRLIKEVTIYDSFGRIRFKQSYNNKQAKLRLPKLKSGIYIVEMSDGKNSERQKLLVY